MDRINRWGYDSFSCAERLAGSTSHEVTLARGWLLERARVRRLREQLRKAQHLAEMHRDAYRDLHADIYPGMNMPYQCGPMFWEPSDTPKGGA